MKVEKTYSFQKPIRFLLSFPCSSQPNSFVGKQVMAFKPQFKSFDEACKFTFCLKKLQLTHGVIYKLTAD